MHNIMSDIHAQYCVICVITLMNNLHSHHVYLCRDILCMNVRHNIVHESCELNIVQRDCQDCA